MATSPREYKCPLCGSALARERYEHVLHIDEGRKAALERAEEDLAVRRRAIEQDRRRILAKAEATAKKAQERARGEATRLREQLDKAKVQLAQKATLSAQQKQEIAREAVERSTSRLAPQMRKLEEERDRAEERRRREADTWKRKIEELQRRTEARDRFHFGPEGEEQLEALLRRQFPGDDIERRGRGGDIIHTVLDRGNACGKIVYECKRTMTWQPAYARQLKRAMELNRTRWGLLVSRALPPRQSGLCIVDEVIVAAPHLAHFLAKVLRDVIVDLARTQLSEEGKTSKTDEVYRYLRGDDFKNAVQAVGERTKELRTSLEREKTSHEGWWQLREQHYGAIARHVAGVENRVHEILATVPGERPTLVRAIRPVASAD